MKVTFDVEKVIRFENVTYELKPEEIEKINKYAIFQGISFEQAFIHYADRIGIIFEAIWDKDGQDYEYNILDLKLEDTNHE